MEPNIIVRIADSGDTVYAKTITDEMASSAKARGTGIAKRSPDYVSQKIQEGNQLIFHKLVKILDSKGLKPMEDLIGKPFDPDTQEAITQIPSPSPEFKGAVVDVVEKGYFLGEKVVRFAKVVTGA